MRLTQTYPNFADDLHEFACIHLELSGEFAKAFLGCINVGLLLAPSGYFVGRFEIVIEIDDFAIDRSQIAEEVFKNLKLEAVFAEH